MSLVNPNSVQFDLKGFISKNGTTYRPELLKIFVEATLTKDNFHILCYRTNQQVNKDIKESLLLIETIVINHNLPSVFKDNAELQLTFESVESEDIYKGSIPFDKFNSDFLRDLEAYGFQVEETELKLLDISGWLNKYVFPFMINKILSSYNKENKINLNTALFLIMVTNKEFENTINSYLENKADNVIPNHIFLEACSYVIAKSKSIGLSTTKTLDMIPKYLELPKVPDNYLLTSSVYVTEVNELPEVNDITDVSVTVVNDNEISE